MKKITLSLFVLCSLFANGVVFGQIRIEVNGATQGGSPNKVETTLDSKRSIMTIDAQTVNAALGQIMSVVISTEPLRAALVNKGCSVTARPALPNSISFNLNNGGETIVTDVTGQTKVYGRRCKTGSCGKRDYLKTFSLTGKMSIKVEGVRQDELIALMQEVTRVGAPHVAYYNQLVADLNNCSLAPRQKQEVTQQVVEEVVRTSAKRCTQKWWKPLLSGGVGLAAGLIVGKPGKKTEGMIYGGIGGALGQIGLCAAGTNSLWSILGGIGIGAGASTITYIKFGERTPEVVPGTGPERVPNCPVGQICGDTRGGQNPPLGSGPNRVPNGNPVVINNGLVGGGTNGTPTINTTNVNNQPRVNTSRSGGIVTTRTEPTAPSGTPVRTNGLVNGSRTTTTNSGIIRTDRAGNPVPTPTPTTNAPRRAGQ